MPSKTNSLIVSVLIPVGILLYSFSLEAQNIKGTPTLYTNKEQIITQIPARQFFTYQAKNTDQTRVSFSVNRFFQTEFTIQNTGASYKNHTILWCYLPFSNGYNQIVPKVSTSDEALLFRDSYGNLFLRFDLKDIPPYATGMVRVDCQVLKSTRRAKLTGADKGKPIIMGNPIMGNPKEYLSPDELLEVNHPQIIELSKKLKQKEPFDTAKRVFDWVAGNVKYSGFDKQDKGALHGLIYREGDCTEQAALFTSLCRANNIPARLIWGYRCRGNCQGGELLHTWSEFYADGAWHVADVTNRVFDEEYENYIGLVNYHGVDPNPLEKKHRYRMDFTYEDVKTRIDINSVVRLH